MSELAYSSRFVKPKIIGIMDRVLEGSNAVLSTRIIRSSKNKVKILSEYKIPSKNIEKDKERDLTCEALTKLNQLFGEKSLDKVLS